MRALLIALMLMSASATAQKHALLVELYGEKYGGESYGDEKTPFRFDCASYPWRLAYQFQSRNFGIRADAGRSYMHYNVNPPIDELVELINSRYNIGFGLSAFYALFQRHGITLAPLLGIRYQKSAVTRIYRGTFTAAGGNWTEGAEDVHQETQRFGLNVGGVVQFALFSHLILQATPTFNAYLRGHLERGFWYDGSQVQPYSFTLKLGIGYGIGKRSK